MHNKHIITIAGKPGSGKSSTAKMLAARFGYDHFSSGDLFRSIVKEKGFELLQGNLAAEQEVEIDHAVDQRLREIGDNDDKKVIDSRTAWHWIPSSYKVYLDLDLVTAAHRILGDGDEARLANERVHDSYEDYAVVLQQRLDSEARRYKSLYDINPYDMSNYNLVVDSAAHNLNEVADLIQTGYEKWLKDHS